MLFFGLRGLRGYLYRVGRVWFFLCPCVLVVAVDIHRWMRGASEVCVLGCGTGPYCRRGLFGRIKVVPEVLAFVLDCGAHMLRCASQK